MTNIKVEKNYQIDISKIRFVNIHYEKINKAMLKLILKAPTKTSKFNLSYQGRSLK